MKRKFYSTLLLAGLSITLFAQKGERVIGVFTSGKNFSEGKLSYTMDCNSQKSKILLNDFFIKKYITVKRPDTSFTVLKNSIWGYQTCDKQVYRFLNKKELLLLNANEEILIYKHILPKTTSGRTNATRYYFSLGKKAEVQSLTINKLKAAFSNNKKFKSLIDNDFKYNTDLAAYDETNQIYKINWLLKQTQ